MPMKRWSRILGIILFALVVVLALIDLLSGGTTDLHSWRDLLGAAAALILLASNIDV